MRTLPYRRLQLSRAFAVWMGTVLRPEQTFNDVAELDIATASYAIRGICFPDWRARPAEDSAAHFQPSARHNRRG